MDNNMSVPILIPLEPNEFWKEIRAIVREEVSRDRKEKTMQENIMDTPGLTEKPLYKINEVCSLFQVTKPTIYEWIKQGKLKRIKIRSRVYFLNSEIKQLMHV